MTLKDETDARLDEMDQIVDELFPAEERYRKLAHAQVLHYQMPVCRHGWPTDSALGLCPPRCEERT